MGMMRLMGAAATAGFVIALPILLFTTNIRFLASDTGFLERGLRQHGAEEATGLALSELDYAAGAIVRYFEDDAETLRITVRRDEERLALFNAEETVHMRDVKRLLRALYRGNEVALGFVLAYVAGTVLWSGERSGRDLARRTLMGVGVGAAVGAVVGILALTGFETAWEGMHEVLFTNDFWLLDPDEDRLIQMFPEPFWEEATLIVAGMALAEAGLLLTLAGGYLWFTRARGGGGTRTGGAPAAEEEGEAADEESAAAPAEASEAPSTGAV